MTPRDYVKAAIEHRETNRVPYNIALTGNAANLVKTTFWH